MIKKILGKFRENLLQNTREEKLSKYFKEIICEYHKDQNIKILDFGSGFQPKIAFYINSHLKNNNKNVIIHCYDYYKEIDLKNLNKSSEINFKSIDQIKKNSEKFSFLRQKRAKRRPQGINFLHAFWYFFYVLKVKTVFLSFFNFFLSFF